MRGVVDDVVMLTALNLSEALWKTVKREEVVKINRDFSLCPPARAGVGLILPHTVPTPKKTAKKRTAAEMLGSDAEIPNPINLRTRSASPRNGADGYTSRGVQATCEHIRRTIEGIKGVDTRLELLEEQFTEFLRDKESDRHIRADQRRERYEHR